MSDNNKVNEIAVEETYKALGNVVGFQGDNNTVTFNLEEGKAKITFLKENIVRVFIDTKGEFIDDTKGKILAKSEDDLINENLEVEIDIVEEKEHYKLESDKVILKAYKAPFKLEAYKKNGVTPIFKEIMPIEFKSESIKHVLEGDKDEFFYGGGVQNGYFSHKNRSIPIELKVSHWNAGSVSNPAPFYMSTKGYGVLRNTFKKGRYDFFEETTLLHDENKSDSFYFFGDTLGEVLDLYTELTGKPSLIPRWGLMPGDANCYKETMDALKVANKYIEHNIPRGWILPNDGYGCGYTDLKGFVTEAEKLGFKVGLWTENSVDKIAQEVKEFGSRAVKTDVAWVGPGYEFALDGVKLSYDGIENNCDSRGYVWTCCGWAGTQRYSTVWSGDQFGDWEYIRMHIPTYICSGLSGNPYCGSDIDAIFAGSAETQVRDLQWKCFTPILIQMSGWAPKDKQAWVWEEPYTTINRNYLNLKLRLTPYMYTYAHKSYVDATPIMRPMLWDYSNEKYTLTKDTQYQFMLGDYFLVAPIFEKREDRDAIYLPDEKQVWIDYFTGEQYNGGQVINSFPAPLEKLPLFVKNGAIIPMYPLGRFDGDVLPGEENPLTLDLYPHGESTFELYEDDGNTKEHRSGAYATTLISMSAPEYTTGPVTVRVNDTKGTYKGISEKRRYEFMIHTNVNPGKVNIGDLEFNMCDTKEAYDSNSSNVMYFDETTLGGVLYIKTEALCIREAFELSIERFNNEAPAREVVHENIPEVPQNLGEKEVFDTKVVIQWNEVEEATTYDLLIDGMLFSNVSNPYEHRELEFTTTYSYKVRANNTKGSSAWSEEVSVTTLESSLRDVLTEEDMTVKASSERPGYDAAKAINGDGGSMWMSESKGESDLPADYIMEFKDAYKINKFEYKSRPQGTKGNISKYNLAVSQDGVHYKYIVNDGVWSDSDEPHFVDFKEEIVAKYVKVEALEGNENYANAIHFKPYKAPETDKVILGDYTGGGKVDENDLTFVRNYIGVVEGDNDWDYVKKCDINYNGIIDAYDLAFVGRMLEESKDEGKDEAVKEVKGEISLETSVLTAKKDEVFEVNVVGKDMENVYAFHAMIALDTDKFEHTKCLGRRCKKEVIASSSELSDHMINASTVKEDENGTKLMIAFSGKGDSKTINEDGVLAKFSLRAKEDCEINLEILNKMTV